MLEYVVDESFLENCLRLSASIKNYLVGFEGGCSAAELLKSFQSSKSHRAIKLGLRSTESGGEGPDR